MRTLPTLVSLLLAAHLHGQARIYVDQGATGNGNGQSWADAVADLHAALSLAQAGDEVWVAEGLYKTTADTDRTVSFRLPSGVRLYGGFAGWESAPGQRDWAAHPTVLDGDIGATGDSTDNAYNVMWAEEVEEGTLLDGLTFRSGTAEPGLLYDPFQRDGCGGGLYVNAGDGVAYLVVRNCRFERNYARLYGGAVLVRASNNGSIAPQFLNCTFAGNTSAADGGAVYCYGYVDLERIPDFGECLFEANACGRWGKALAYKGGSVNDTLHVWDCSFLRNRNGTIGFGFDVVTYTDNHLRFNGCLFEGIVRVNGVSNVCIRTEFFDPTTQSARSCYIDNCVFRKNDALSAYTFSKDTRIRHCIISENLGGLVQDESPNLVIENVTYVGNRSSLLVDVDAPFDPILIHAFGGVRKVSNVNFILNKPRSSTQPFLLFRTAKEVSFQNIEVIGNDSLNANIFSSAPYPHITVDSIWLRHTNFIGNRFIFRSQNSEIAPIRISNSMFYGNQIETNNFLGGFHQAILDHCAFDSLDCSLLPTNVTCGPNNLFNLDPLFRDTASHDYSLLPCSPLIDAGSNAAAAGILTDIAGSPRIQGGRVDIGAYEAPAFGLAGSPVVKPACAGASDGSISISPVSGCEPYTYYWLPDAGNGPELVGLPPGLYAYTVTDGAGRQILDTLLVAEAPVPALHPVVTDVQCGSPLGGSIAAGVSSGTAPYHYHWLPTGLPDASYLSHLPAIAAGGGGPIAYAVTVTDANGCQDSASAAIALLGAITLSVDGRTVSCWGAADGWLSAAPATGAAPFTWAWQGWPGTDSLARPLGPGNYAVTVEDAYGCTASFAFPPMAQPDSLWATAGASSQTDPDMPDGAAVVTTISGGTSPYGFEWSTGGTGQAIAGLVTGYYSVTVKDKNGCEATVEVFVDSMFTATGEAEGDAWLIYPNPAADWATVLLPRPLPGGHLELAAADGRGLTATVPTFAKASAGKTADWKLDLSGLPAGTYALRVLDRAGKLLFVGKVVKR